METKEYIICDCIYVKFKNKQNEPIVFKVKGVINIGGGA